MVDLSSDYKERAYTSAVFDPRPRPDSGCPNGCAYVFGGRNFVRAEPALPGTNPAEDKAVFEEVFRFDPKSKTISAVSFSVGGVDRAQLPEARFGAAAVWDPNNNVAFLFGGGKSNYWQRDEELSSDPFAEDKVLRFDPDQKWVTELCIRLPQLDGGERGERERAAAVWDPTRSAAYIFGGGHDVKGSDVKPGYVTSKRVLRWGATAMGEGDVPMNPTVTQSATFNTATLLSDIGNLDPDITHPDYVKLGEIVVEWDPPSCDRGLPPTYQVWRRAELRSGNIIDWTLVDQVIPPLLPGVTVTTQGRVRWVDKNGSFGVRYFYKVSAVNALNTPVTFTQGSEATQTAMGQQVYCPDGGILYCSDDEWRIDTPNQTVKIALHSLCQITGKCDFAGPSRPRISITDA